MNKYEVREALELLDLKRTDIPLQSFEDENSKAHIYILTSGRIILFPSVGNMGLLIADKITLDTILNSRIPIVEKLNPFQLRQDDVISLPNRTAQLLNRLTGVLNIKIELNNDSEPYFKEIDKAVKKYGYQKFYDSLFIEFGIFVGEKIRTKYLLTWVLKKQYSVNPYYEPFLSYGDKEITPFYKLSHLLLERKGFSFKEYFERVLWFTKAYSIPLINNNGH